MTTDQPPTWLAINGPADYVRLVEVPSAGPDVFVRWTDWKATADEASELAHELTRAQAEIALLTAELEASRP